MLQRVPSTSLLTMGSSADFWRGRDTVLSMAYWKKSPSFVAVAIVETPVSPSFIFSSSLAERPAPRPVAAAESKAKLRKPSGAGGVPAGGGGGVFAPAV